MDDRRKNQKCFEKSFEFDGVLSAGIRAQLVTELIKYILFQRQQLPMQYDALKCIIKEETKTKGTPGNGKGPSLKTTSQRDALKRMNDLDIAEKLFGSLSDIFIASAHIKQVLILLGSTIISPKEIYVLNFPTGFYEGPVLKFKQCSSSVFRKLITDDIFNDVPDLKSIMKLSVMILAPRDPDFTAFKLTPQLNYKLPTRGQQFTFNFECHKNVSKMGPELSMVEETFFDISGIEPLNRTVDIDQLDGEMILPQSAKKCAPRTSSVSSAPVGEPYFAGMVPIIEVTDSPGTSAFVQDSGNISSLSIAFDQSGIVDDSHDFVWYLLPQTFKGFKDKAK